ncbi:MAG: UTP--glucose-1-phosphate uridylyltransferase [Novosphingobium sp. 17-62-19]|uniref:UTP--glucose-1-phosphate uridylyltransferase GalU n=1 Tax=Novosphingobium sp. 17-62-19 TaxID=1970406 RepID=UPI000BCBBAAC|nr:UTP--glucose-1-phosphate uridylyltransferase GalU [Novosphingobium sp. 17-62-19]OYX93404.1 MAG: UTP--glucose-1-phosphate uridylyltransferase [Novosphingobium sp. 35-62-5]OZA18918.1 MAG: UTP--glucose-1-phosphate uridylyltransferase [Novosphingobium sp. 17-62-19]HQS95027.1 UTP--glucose-1-phosphate uridylyltransferase GalU [Novosphingobium sp.]
MSSNQQRKPIRKAVFPVAGLGTRFLPATKAIPKEMLPIIDRPLIQYAVDEAREAGIEQLIFVTGRGKTAIVEHFDTAFELEHTMSGRGKKLDVLDATRIQPGNLVTVRQQVPMGLGHAIWCARAVVGDEPFAIFLPDEMMVGEPGGKGGCMKQMVDAYNEVGGNLISVLEVPREEVSSYGVIAPGAKVSDTLTEVTGLVEKPKVADAPSNLIISGRYILQPEVMRTLENQDKGAGGEIQLTDAMARMIGQQPFHAVKFAGRRFDCGSKAGFVEATLSLALERSDMADEVRAIMRRLLAEG